MPTLTYLALGDSYTIGEGVPITLNFPYQTVKILRKQGWDIAAPEIVATTGWTTDELLINMQIHEFLSQYNFASLLIGVNNQYRGRSVQQYGEEFEYLLQQTLEKVNHQPQKICVLSIPDWSITPFAQQKLPDANNRTIEIVQQEINHFNNINKKIAHQYNTHYLDITPNTRKAVNDKSLLALDELHPSQKAYTEWAIELSKIMHHFFKNSI